MSQVRFQIEVMQPMDRPVHRWDTCCRDWWDHAWTMQWELLKAGELGIMAYLLPDALRPILGTCRWHGRKTR